MFNWSLVLLALGVLAFLDSQFNYGYLFRSTNAVLFMLVALGLLIRTRMLEKLGFKEKLLDANKELKANISELRGPQTPMGKREPEQEVVV